MLRKSRKLKPLLHEIIVFRVPSPSKSEPKSMKKTTRRRLPSKDHSFGAPGPFEGIWGAPRVPKCSPKESQGGLKNAPKSIKNGVWPLQGFLGGGLGVPRAYLLTLWVDFFLLFLKIFSEKIGGTGPKKGTHSVLCFKHFWCANRRHSTKKASIPSCFFNIVGDKIGGTEPPPQKKRRAFRFAVLNVSGEKI